MSFSISFFSKIAQIVIVSLVLTLIGGCRSEDPNPELKDPIYQDLNSKADKFEKAVAAEEKALKGHREALESEPVRTVGRKLAIKNLKESKEKVRALKQQAKYYKIRAEKRKVLGRRSYKLAFSKGEEWPKPEEFDLYKKNMALREADLNWNKRVPKLSHNNPNYKRMGQQVPEDGAKDQ